MRIPFPQQLHISPGKGFWSCAFPLDQSQQPVGFRTCDWPDLAPVPISVADAGSGQGIGAKGTSTVCVCVKISFKNYKRITVGEILSLLIKITRKQPNIVQSLKINKCWSQNRKAEKLLLEVCLRGSPATVPRDSSEVLH